MEVKNTLNNEVKVRGTLVEPLVEDHCVFFENFFGSKISIKRKSGTDDVIPFLVSERNLKYCCEAYEGKRVEITGQIRTHNEYNEMTGKRSLRIYIFVKEIEVIDENKHDFNEVRLTGFIAKEPIYRETPFGCKITDILMAVNRYNKTSYIPIIVWGRNARYVANHFTEGTEVQLIGRIQSREYSKTLEDGTQTQKTAYEVSVSAIGKVEEADTQSEE